MKIEIDKREVLDWIDKAYAEALLKVDPASREATQIHKSFDMAMTAVSEGFNRLVEIENNGQE